MGRFVVPNSEASCVETHPISRNVRVGWVSAMAFVAECPLMRGGTARRKTARSAPSARAARKGGEAPSPSPGITRLGRVINGYSNALTMLAIDGAHAAAYRGPDDDADDPNHPDDHDRAIDVGNGILDVGDHAGVVADIGGCGKADVYRIGPALVLAEVYVGDADVDAAAELDRVLAGHPTTRAAKVGTVDVKSGVLVLMGLLEPGPKLALAKVKTATDTQTGCAIRVPPGRYEVWREQFGSEVRGAWGSMHVRVRLVPAGTKVVEGAPIAALAPAARSSSPRGQRRVIDPKGEGAWAAIHSIAIAPDGRLFAGEREGAAAAAWGADGRLLWQRRLAPKKKSKWASEKVCVQWVDGEVVAMVVQGTAEALLVLDPLTGKTRRTIKAPPSYDFLVAGGRMVMCGQDAFVLSYPAGKRVAKLEHHPASLELGVSPDGRWLVLDDVYEFHVYDWKSLAHRRTFKHGMAKGYSCAMELTEDGVIISGDDHAGLTFYDVTGKKLGTLDTARDRTRKPKIEAIAISQRHIGVSRRDGTALLIDQKSRKVIRQFDRHLVDSDAGQWGVEDVAFSADGETLWVSAGLKGEPVGLTGYSIN